MGLGLVIGSFLNVVILRSIGRESIGGRSRCPTCGVGLWPGELIPVVSFVIQKGRCRHCSTALSWQYPAVELGCGILYAAAAWALVPDAAAMDATRLGVLAGAYGVIAAAIVILVADFRFQIIPDSATVVLALVGLAAALARRTLLSDLIAAVAFSLFFTCLWFFSAGRWMGLGDAKLIFATSLLVGLPVSFMALLFAFWLGAIVAIPLLIARKAGLKSHLPFGPFILMGALTAYFFTPYFFALFGLPGSFLF